MKIKDKDLRAAIAAVSIISSRKSAIPVLSEIYAKAAGDGTCLFAATDLETEMCVFAKATGIFEGLLPTKEIAGIAKQNTRSGFFDISGDSKTHIIEGLGKHTINGCEVGDYPMKPTETPAVYGTVNKKRFIEAVNAAAPHCATDILRPTMTGINVEASGGNCLISGTDALTVLQSEIKYSGPDMSFIIPPGALPAIKSLCALSADENIRLSHSGGMIYLGFGRSYIHTRAIEGRYPPIKNIIPKDFYDSISVSPKLIINALEAVLPTCNQTTHLCSMSIQNGKIEISVHNIDLGNEGSITVPCLFSGEPLAKCVNALLLLRVLKSIGGGTVTLQFAKNTAMVVLKDATRTFKSSGTFGLCMLLMQ